MIADRSGKLIDFFTGKSQSVNYASREEGDIDSIFEAFRHREWSSLRSSRVNISEFTACTIFAYSEDDFFDNLPSNSEMEAFERSFE